MKIKKSSTSFEQNSKKLKKFKSLKLLKTFWNFSHSFKIDGAKNVKQNSINFFLKFELPKKISLKIKKKIRIAKNYKTNSKLFVSEWKFHHYQMHHYQMPYYEMHQK